MAGDTPPRKGGIADVPQSFFAITPADDEDLPQSVRGIHVGVAGNVAAIGAGDTEAVTFKGCQAGSTLLGRFSRVLDTGTTATDLVGLV
jgi:hypothetical protein